jgi:hypothetical protein
MNLFRRKDNIYDLRYLTADDLKAKPSVDKIFPKIGNDPALIASLYAVDPEAPPEVADYFKKKALLISHEEKSKYSEAFAKMTETHIIYSSNNDLENKIIINEKIS